MNSLPQTHLLPKLSLMSRLRLHTWY